MNENNPRTDEQQSTEQKHETKLPATEVANIAGNKPDGSNKDKKTTRHTQQQDDKDGYPRDWYSPSHPGILKDRALKRTHDYSPIANIAIGLAAFFVILWQGWIYVDQTKLMEKQWTEMRDTRELENRAWVGVKQADMVDLPKGGVQFNVTYVNGGNSPAVCSIEVTGGYRDSSPPDQYDFGKMPFQGSKIAIFPNSEYVSIAAILSEAPRVDMVNREHAYYIWGKLSYADIFSRPHTTRFCLRFQASSIVTATRRDEAPVGTEGAVGILALCPTHNSFD